MFPSTILPSRRVGDAMHRVSMLILLLSLLAIVVLSFHGCATGQPPKRTAFVSVEAATDVVNGVGDAYEAHLLTKDDLRHLLPYADAVKAAQVRVNKAIADKVDVSTYMQALTDATSELLTQQAAAKRRPSTQPATKP